MLWIQRRQCFSNWSLLLSSESSWLLFISEILLHLIMQDFLVTMFDDNVNRTRRRELIAVIVYWDFHYTMQNWLKIIESFICCIVCRVNSCKVNIFFVKQYEVSAWSQIVILVTFVWSDYWRYNCVLIDFLLILLNVNFYRFDFELHCIHVISQLCHFSIWKCIAFISFLDFKKVSNHCITSMRIDDRMFLIFDVLQRKQNDRSRCFRIVSR